MRAPSIFSKERMPKEPTGYSRRVLLRIAIKFWYKPLGYLIALVGIILIKWDKLDL